MEDRIQHPNSKTRQIPQNSCFLPPNILLSSISKVLEILVLAKITPVLNLSPTQHGFRSQYSTSNFLTNLSQKILEGLNSNKPAPCAKAVISPTLFNLFLHDLPSPQQPNVSIASYVDDLTLVSTDPNITIPANKLHLYLAQLENWLATNRMSVSAQKSSITVFTPNNKEYNSRPIITLNGTQTPLTPSTEILDTTYDRGMTFKDHTTDLTN